MVGRMWPVACIALALPACDVTDPLGTQPEHVEQVVAPLELTGWVVDEAAVLSEEQEADITRRLQSLHRTRQAHMIVVTTPSLDGRSIEEYSLALGRGWGIGDAQRNDGLLIVLAPVERQVRIEVGTGLEATINDPFAKQVVDAMIPSLRAGDYHDGLTLGIERLSDRLHRQELDTAA